MTSELVNAMIQISRENQNYRDGVIDGQVSMLIEALSPDPNDPPKVLGIPFRLKVEWTDGDPPPELKEALEKLYARALARSAPVRGE